MNKLKDIFEKNTLRIVICVILLIALILLAVVVSLYLTNFSGPFSNNHRVWSEAGSYFGGMLGAVFAFLALLTLLFTLDIQHKELKETRSTLQRQNFEYTFFEQLRMFRETTNNLKNPSVNGLMNSQSQLIGLDLIRHNYEELTYMSTSERLYPESNPERLKKDQVSRIANISVRNPALEGFYFGFIGLAKYLINSDVSRDEEHLQKYIYILLTNTPPEGLCLLLAKNIFSDYEIDTISKLGIKKYLKSIRYSSYLTS